MSYKKRYGITQIRKSRYLNLQINWDFNSNPDNIRERYPVFLFTPDMDDTDDHHHIPLTRSEAKKLHRWLGDYLKEQSRITKTRRK